MTSNAKSPSSLRTAIGDVQSQLEALTEHPVDPARFFVDVLPALLGQEGVVLPDDVVVRFEVRGAGVWDLQSDGCGGVSIGQASGPWDCTVSVALEDWPACTGGRVSMMRAFADGRLTISGDVGLLLRIQEVLIGVAA